VFCHAADHGDLMFLEEESWAVVLWGGCVRLWRGDPAMERRLGLCSGEEKNMIG